MSEHTPTPLPASTPPHVPTALPERPDYRGAADGPAAPRPWYRREPWLAVVAASIVPFLAAAVSPPVLHVPLVAVAGILIVVACVLLVRQGPFRG